MKPVVIAGFPGVGKSYLYDTSELTCVDSDSSKFSKLEDGSRNPNFVSEYVTHIEEAIKQEHVEVVLVSTHQEVREELYKRSIPFTLVIPHRSAKEEFLERYEARGNDAAFIDLVRTNWDDWLDELESQEGCDLVHLHGFEYLSDLEFSVKVSNPHSYVYV